MHNIINDNKGKETIMEEANPTDKANQDKVAALANARYSSLPQRRPGDLMGGAKSTSFARRGPPPPIKIAGGSSFKNNPFLQKK